MRRTITVGRGGGRPAPASVLEAPPRHRIVEVGPALQEEIEGPVALGSIDTDAQTALNAYWSRNPDKYREERAEHGTDPVANPLAFYRIELGEPQHADVLAMVERDGVMHLDAAEAWAKEEAAELPEEDENDEEYQALLKLARQPLPELDEPLPAPPAEFVSDVTDTLRELAASGQQATSETVRDALQAVGVAHQQTMDAVRGVLTAAASGQQGGHSDALTIAALGVLDDFARRPPAPAPVVHVHTPRHDLNVHVDTPEIHPTFNVEAPAPAEINVDVHVPEQAAPQVTVNTPAPVVQAAAAPVVNVTAPVADPKPKSVRIEYDDEGFKHFVPVMDEA